MTIAEELCRDAWISRVELRHCKQRRRIGAMRLLRFDECELSADQLFQYRLIADGER